MQMTKFHAKSMVHLKLEINSSKGQYGYTERNKLTLQGVLSILSILLSEIDAANVHSSMEIH